jgi:hypothetical protein
LIWYSPTFICLVLTFLSALHRHEIFDTINTVASNHFHSSKFHNFRPIDHMISMECSALDFRCQSTQQIDRCRFNVRYTDSDYPFGIFKLFYIISFWQIKHPYGGVTRMLIQTNG